MAGFVTQRFVIKGIYPEEHACCAGCDAGLRTVRGGGAVLDHEPDCPEVLRMLGLGAARGTSG